MRKRWLLIILSCGLVLSIMLSLPQRFGAHPSNNHMPPALTHTQVERTASKSKTLQEKPVLLAHKPSTTPTLWGDHIPGILTRLDTKEKIIALTFDACGGSKGNGYDSKLIDYLIVHHIPVTLFVNARWIDANPLVFQKLASHPLFEIENHGTAHRPLSVTGHSIYGIHGTQNTHEVTTEIMNNEEKIAHLTGRRPLFFRSGTAYYDDVAISIVHELGLQPVNYNVLGDAGATYNTRQVYTALMKAQPGSIVIGHMNHPEKDTAEGVIQAIPMLLHKGYHFVQLMDYKLTNDY